jgi:hypothetical protein
LAQCGIGSNPMKQQKSRQFKYITIFYYYS